MQLCAHDVEPTTSPLADTLSDVPKHRVTDEFVALRVHGSMTDLECSSFFPLDEDQESCAEEELDLFGLIEVGSQRLREECPPRGVLLSIVSEFQEVAHEYR